MIKKIITLFKRIVSSVIINNFTGKLISNITSDKFKCYTFTIDTSNPLINPAAKAAIFFNKYESAEYRFITKHLFKQYDVVELGASLGIISCVIRKRLNQDKRLIAVEANPNLIETINKNIQLNNLGKNFFLINSAISYNSNEYGKIIFQQRRDSLLGSVSKDFINFTHDKNHLVNSIKLTDILNEYKIKDYSLVCDIEGMEIELVLNEKESFRNCKQIIIETHNTTSNKRSYLYSDIAEIILKTKNFNLVDAYGPVYVFSSNIK